MRKYWTYFRLSILAELEYRADLVVRLLSNLIPVLGIYFIWRSLYLSGITFGTYNLKHLSSYFLVAALMDLITPTFMVIESLGKEIQSGLLSAIIVKPVSYPLFKMDHFGGERAFRLVVALAIVGASIFLFGSHLSYPPNWLGWLAFTVSGILAVILAYFTFFSLSICAFWLTRVLGLAFSLTVLASFLGGAFVPLDLLPSQLQLIINLLPFKYIVYFPAQVFLSQINSGQILQGILLQFLWIGLTGLLTKPLWKIGLNRFEAVGS